MTQNCLGTIRSIYAKLSEKEKKIADYILEKPEIIIHRTINEVADDLNIADATVFRFSKRIGFKGFQAMKIALASEIINSDRVSDPDSSVKHKKSNLAEKVFKANIRGIEQTLYQLDTNLIKKASELILDAKRVEFFGSGGSSIIAMDAFHKFAQAGIKAYTVTDTQLQLLSASHLSKDDTAVIIFDSASIKDAVNIFRTVSKTGARTIVITDSSKSSISMNADVTIYSVSEGLGELPDYFSSRIAQLIILDTLCLYTSPLNRGENDFQAEY